MAKKRASSSGKRGAGQSATRGGRQARAHQTRAQTRTQATPQPEVVNGGPQATSQAQAQVQLNVAANQTPQLAPQQKFIDRCEEILTTLGLKETRGVEFPTFLFSGSAESWWISIQRGRQAGLPPITWSEFLALFKDRFIPLSKQDDMRRQFNNLRQGIMTVTEYEAKFTDLSRYVPYLVEDPREKVR
ncbi:uncharacterized protein LOC132607759 [Lycium barbarum]|uniref:uncharacterized protein LOC132607759 n=1 Tax=Lycium barbarum TaxID=112863 RepID=UPI00293F020D|nr:uncharacterized protein LOC132607759 [Lycium barbarum]